MTYVFIMKLSFATHTHTHTHTHEHVYIYIYIYIYIMASFTNLPDVGDIYVQVTDRWQVKV